MADAGIYLHNWATVDQQVTQDDGTRIWRERPATSAESRKMLAESFSIPESTLDGANILLASYTYEDYSGSAYVLFERDGTLYEVVGSHCSCMGLEEQWEPEETSVAALVRHATEEWVDPDYLDTYRSVVDCLATPAVVH